MFDWIKRMGLGAAALPLVAQAQAQAQPTMRVIEAGDYRIHLDLSGQVLRLSLPGGIKMFPDLRPAATLRNLDPGFTSAALLAVKAKQFDDGLYAAVELALQNGAGPVRGKRALLDAVAGELAKLPAAPQGNAGTVLFAARQLGEPGATAPAAFSARAAGAVRAFQADSLRSKPIAFYTWSEGLRRIFQQDRMLQTELEGAEGTRALAQALERSGSGPEYEALLAFVSRLTNPPPPEKADLRPALHGAAAPPGGLCFFPPSRAHETELVKRLFSGVPIPADFDLAATMIRELRSGKLDLTPRDDSGWYDFQTWANGALVTMERLPEGQKLQIDPSYREQLDELFKALQALTRETHIKQLEIPPAGAAAPRRPPLRFAPELSVEPAFTYYVRRAAGYAFLSAALEKHFGREALGKMRRLTPDGPAAPDLWSELQDLTALFRGAAAVAARELGLPLEQPAPADTERFRRWAEAQLQDADLSRDLRMMVPVFYDLERRKTKVWAFLGWDRRSLLIQFAGRPGFRITDKDGKPAPADLEVELGAQWSTLAVPVVAELYVSRMLDRTEFRVLCDERQTISAILAKLREL